MAIGTKVCKVCGMEYEACRTLRPNLNNEFRWQDVACSPEHGAEYLRRVLAARCKAAPAAESADAAETGTQEKRSSRRRVRKQDNE